MSNKLQAILYQSRKKKGLGKKSKPQSSSSRVIEKLIPLSLNTQIPLNPSISSPSTSTMNAILDMDIESMPIDLEDDLFVEREEILIEQTETEQDTNVDKDVCIQQVNKKEAIKEFKVKILSDQNSYTESYSYKEKEDRR